MLNGTDASSDPLEVVHIWLPRSIFRDAGRGEPGSPHAPLEVSVPMAFAFERLGKVVLDIIVGSSMHLLKRRDRDAVLVPEPGWSWRAAAALAITLAARAHQQWMARVRGGGAPVGAIHITSRGWSDVAGSTAPVARRAGCCGTTRNNSPALKIRFRRRRSPCAAATMASARSTCLSYPCTSSAC